MSWSWVQGNSTFQASGATISLTLSSPPTQGNVVCVGLALRASNTNPTVQDGSSNLYRINKGSNSANLSLYGYYLFVPPNADATITASNLGSGASFPEALFADEFSYSGGAFYLEQQCYQESGPPGSANFNAPLSPSLKALRAGSLFYSVMNLVVRDVIANGITGVGTPWTQGGGAIQNSVDNKISVCAEYILSAPAGVTNPNYVNGSANSGQNYVMAFIFSPTVDSLEPGLTSDEWHWLGGDEY